MGKNAYMKKYRSCEQVKRNEKAYKYRSCEQVKRNEKAYNTDKYVGFKKYNRAQQKRKEKELLEYLKYMKNIMY